MDEMRTRRPTWLLTALVAIAAAGSPLLILRCAPAHGAPPDRYGAAMAADRDGHVVLFGGRDRDRGRLLSDTWTWDGAGWVERRPAGPPPGRDLAAAAYDPVRRETVIFGGGDRSDTWTWDGARWAERHPASPPPPGFSRQMAWVPAVGRVVLLVGHEGEETWTWDGTGWTTVAVEPFDAGPPASPMRGAAADRRGRFVLVGQTPHAPAGHRDQTWAFDASGWRLLGTAATPGGGISRMAYDAARRLLVLVRPDGTWTWDGESWTHRRPVHRPPPLGERDPGPPAMAYDAASRRVVLFSSGQTWTWDGADWSRSA